MLNPGPPEFYRVGIVFRPCHFLRRIALKFNARLLMPSNPKGYMGDYYHANKEKFNNPKEKHKRALRNVARAHMAKKLGVLPTQIKGDVDHIKPLKNGGSGDMGNLRILPASKNRARK